MSATLVADQETVASEHESGATEHETSASEQQFATFYVGNILLGVDICQVQEINRQLNVTEVPQSPDHIRGVINLRGEVTTVADLRKILGLPSGEITRDGRNLIVTSQGESIGFLVDRISDILTLRSDQISPPPSNVDGISGRFFTGVHTMDSEIVVLLDIEEALSDRNREE
jgi:purine-binding chemotaxis protein CheW